MLNFMVTPESQNLRASDLDKSLSIDLGPHGSCGPVGLASLLVLPAMPRVTGEELPAESLSQPPMSACHLGLDDGRHC